MNDDERLRLMETTLPRREAARLSFEQQLPERQRLLRILHPLDAAPTAQGWNHAELADLLPDGEPQQAAVLVGFVPRPQGTCILLTRRTDGLRNHAGQVSFPGGRIESTDMDVVAAAMRESQEEIALLPGQIAPLGFLDPFTTISGFRVVPVVAVVDPGYVARPDPAEVAEVFEVPLDYLMTPDNLRRVELDYRGRPRTVLEYAWPAHRIWGATASVLFNLREKLESIR